MAQRKRKMPLKSGGAGNAEIDLQRILRFFVLAEELSFTRAARRLGLDQAWLSRQIQQLEADLGFPLFHRDTRSVELSGPGAAFLGYAAELARVAERIRVGASEIARAHRSEFRLGVAPFTFWVPARQELTRRFEEKFEGDVQIVSTSSSRLATKLLERELDAVIMAPQFVVEGLESEVIHRSWPGLLVPSEDPLAKRGCVQISDLIGRRFAVTDPGMTPAYDQMYGPLEAAGAIPVVILEGRKAIHHYARIDRLVIVTQAWPTSEQGALDDFTYCEIAPSLPPVEYAAVRRREPQQPSSDLFWELVLGVAKGIEISVGANIPKP